MYLHFASAFIFILIAGVLVLATIAVFALIRPIRPGSEKLSPYECGERPVGTPWVQFNIRYYIICLIFIIFEVEILFMLPWAVVFNHFKEGPVMLQQAAPLATNLEGATGLLVLLEMVLFILILAVGLAYVWAKGHLEWVREVSPTPQVREES